MVGFVVWLVVVFAVLVEPVEEPPVLTATLALVGAEMVGFEAALTAAFAPELVALVVESAARAAPCAKRARARPSSALDAAIRYLTRVPPDRASA